MTTSYLSEAQETVNKVRQALETSKRPNLAAGPAANRNGATQFEQLPEYEVHKITRAVGDITGIANPFHRLHDGRAGATTEIDGRTVVNFSSYDYLGLNGHPEVVAAAKDAI